jgi:hypothetical protein
VIFETEKIAIFCVRVLLPMEHKSQVTSELAARSLLEKVGRNKYIKSITYLIFGNGSRRDSARFVTVFRAESIAW